MTVLELTNCGTKQEIRHFHTRLTWLYEADLEEHIKEHLVQQMKPVREDKRKEREKETDRQRDFTLTWFRSFLIRSTSELDPYCKGLRE